MTLLLVFLAGMLMGCALFTWYGWHRIERRTGKRLVDNLRKAGFDRPIVDVLQPQPPKQLTCSLCGATIRQHPAMVNDKCDECRAMAFEVAEERDRREWDKGGVIVVKDFMGKR